MSVAKKQKTIFGHRLTLLMKERNMNDADLAELFGRERKYISIIRYSEKGPRLNELVIMANTFGVSIEYLAGLSSTRVPEIRTVEKTVEAPPPKRYFDKRWEG